jgi:prefoldin subunit 5
VIFSGLNQKRLSFLFLAGVGAEKLSKFLDESRLRLMSLGAQYYKRSRGGAEDFAFMMRLPPAAESIVRAWLRGEIEFTPTLQPEALIAQFQAIERDKIDVPVDQMREFALQGLAYLANEDAPAAWLKFLASDIGQKPEEDRDVDEPQELRPSLTEVVDAFERKSGGTEHNDLNRVIAVFAALQAGDVGEASKSAADIESVSVAEKLKAAIARHGEAAAKPGNVVRQLAQHPSGDVDLSDVELIGLSRPRSSDDGPMFIRIVAFRVDDTVYSLGSDQVADWLNNQHEIIGFPNTRNVRLPKGPELGAWIVEKYSTSQPIKVRVTRNGRPLYTLLQLNAERSQPDSIRDAIKQAAVAQVARPVFGLSDGSAVCMPSEVANLAEYEFEEPLEWFRQLPTWEIAGRRVALGPLPNPDDYIDCSDISSVLKRLLRSKEAQANLPKMTQAQIQGLASALRAEPGGLTLMRIERVHQSLSKFAESAERLATIIPELLATRDVRAEIDEAKKAILAGFLAEQTKAKAERDRLAKEIAELKKRRDAVEEEIKETASEVRKAVRKSFEKARDAGTGTLGDVAVLSAILGSHGSAERTNPTIAKRQVPARVGGLASDLGTLGAAMVEAKAAELFIVAVLAEGLPLLVRGPLSNHYGVAIGAAISIDHANIVDVPLGVLDAAAVTPMVHEARQGDAIVVTGFNLSPYESYGGSITDRMLRNFAGPPGRGPHVILTAVESPIGLPVPSDVENLAATLDTRWLVSGWDREGTQDQGRQVVAGGGNVLRANALVRVASAVSGMEDPFRRIANAFLARQGLAPS